MAGAGNPAQQQRPQGNVYQQSAQALGQAQGLAGQAGNYNPMQVQADPYAAATVAGTNLGQYQNPYTRQVIDTSMRDLNRGRQMALNDVGAQATAAGAFGGSRHGIAEAATNGEFARAAGSMASGLRAQGFNTALGAAQGDVAAQNQAGQFNAGQNLQGQLANQGAGLQQAGNMLGAAGQLGSLSNLGFGMGQQIGATQAQQGAQQQALMQQLINAGRGQWGGLQGSAQGGLGSLLGAVNGSPGAGAGTQQTSQNPGVFNYLSLLLGM